MMKRDYARTTDTKLITNTHTKKRKISKSQEEEDEVTTLSDEIILYIITFVALDVKTRMTLKLVSFPFASFSLLLLIIQRFQEG